jgi:hypothetical protein
VGRLPFSAHEAAGASAPGIPCALCSRRDNEFAEPGQDRAAGTGSRADTGCILRQYQLAATTWNSLYGCTDPFMLLATRKAGGLGQSSNRNNKGDEEAN